jgi:hypothetical protein
MTRDKIIRMAREAGCSEPSHPMNDLRVSQEALERFAELVAAAQREECAQVCEAIAWSDEAKFFAKAIRERSET